MKENLDDLIRLNTSNMVVWLKQFDALESNKQAALRDLNSAKSFLSAIENYLVETIPREKKLHASAEIFTVDDFLTAEQCDELIPVIRSELEKGGVTNKANTDPGFRTSQVHSFYEHTQERQQICDYLGLHPNYGEPMVGQIYQKGQEFKLHSDYFQSEVRPQEYNYYSRQQGGQRTWTFQVYLTNVEEGGETVFPKLEVSVKPKRGMALIWNNLKVDGTANTDMLHASLPVVKGEKIIITQWFRSGIWTAPAIEEPKEVEE
jgi:prolyl 4-hydroxylase